jgi:quinoprotein glucose dehydrogenase
MPLNYASAPQSKVFNAALPSRIFALVLAVAAAPLLWWGGELISLGGSPYYVLAGIGFGISATLLLFRRAAGAWLYAAILALTIAWAFWEAGPRFWPLVPRLGGLLALGLVLSIPSVWKPLQGWPRGRLKVREGCGLVTIGLVVPVFAGLALHSLYGIEAKQPIYQNGTTKSPSPTLADVELSGDWKHYGNDLGGSRFSALSQINTGNVKNLEVAWTFRIGPDAKGNLPMMEVNPLKIGDSVYVCTAYGDVVSLDAETGEQNWRYRSGKDMSWVANGQCRGLGYFKTNGLQACNERLYINVLDVPILARTALSICWTPWANGRATTISRLPALR